MNTFRRAALNACVGACTLAVAWPCAADPAHAREARRGAALMTQASPTVLRLASEVVRIHDQHARPFAILDKEAAALYLFEPEGRMLAATPVLLGLAKGDFSVPGIGERPLAQVKPAERTTPAGRYELEAGVNTRGDRIFWVDYDAAVSMHSLRALDAKERREQRLATPTAADNRISFGCINVPSAFYDRVVTPTFGRSATPRERGVIYILPEQRPLASVFPQFALLSRPDTRAKIPEAP